MRYLKALIAISGYGVSSVWATVLPVTVTVGYSSAQDAQAVPFSPSALALLALLLGVFAYSKLRGKGMRAMGVVIALCIAGAASLTGVRNSYAPPGYIVELSSGNPATGMGDTGLWVISNSLPAAARITSITVSNGLPWIGSGSGGAPACVLGLQLAAAGQCAMIVGSPG